MTPIQPEEEARRDECVRIVEELAKKPWLVELVKENRSPPERPFTHEEAYRILAVAKPPKPKQWPLEIARWEDHTAQVVEVDSGERQFLAIVAVQDGGSGHIGPLPISDKHMDRLFVAWAEERGIDLERMERHAKYAGTGGSVVACNDARAIRAVRDNAKEAST